MKFLPVVNFLLIVGLAIYLLSGMQEKKGYVLNQQVFNGFTGKVELERKLASLQEKHRSWLDSVGLLIQGGKKELIPVLQQNASAFELEQRQLSEKYTEDIWKQINGYVADYGKENGYDFIFGASGSGNLMYANDALDITNDITAYINERYKSGR